MSTAPGSTYSKVISLLLPPSRAYFGLDERDRVQPATSNLHGDSRAQSHRVEEDEAVTDRADSKAASSPADPTRGNTLLPLVGGNCREVPYVCEAFRAGCTVPSGRTDLPTWYDPAGET